MPNVDAAQRPRLPLSRFTVLDLTLARAGPCCTRTLADWGANVIRVETPPRTKGDDELLGTRDGSDFQNLNRNKRSVTINLKSDEGREIFMRLAEMADVIVENMRPGVTKRLGIDFESVKQRNPRLIYGSISGFGQYGPYSERPLFDQVAQGMSGIMSVTGIPGHGPLRAGVAITDIMAGTLLAQGLLVALLDREITGEGRWVQTSLIEAGIAILDFQAVRWLVDKKLPEQEGNFHPTGVPMGAYPTADGYVNLGATSNANFQKMCHLVGLEALATDPRFATSNDRRKHRDVLNELIAVATRKKTTKEWFEILVAGGVPSGPIYNVRDVFEDPQVKTLRINRTVHHQRLGELDLVAQPYEITGFDRALERQAPDLGEHTTEVLSSLGYEPGAIEKLRAAGIV